MFRYTVVNIGDGFQSKEVTREQVVEWYGEQYIRAMEEHAMEVDNYFKDDLYVDYYNEMWR